MGNVVRHLLPLLVLLGAATLPAAADDCAAKCRAEEARCLQDSKGDTAKCNAVATQCYQSCRKPK